MLTPQEARSIYAAAYHWRYEDNLPWKFVTGMVNQCLNTSYTIEKVKRVCEKERLIEDAEVDE